MRTFAKCLALLLLLLILPAAAIAQSLTGSLAGKVKDEQGGALPGASLTLTSKTGSKTGVTDATGTYRFLALDPGLYQIRAELSGFRPLKRENVVVSVGSTVEIDFALKVGGMTENLEVLGEAPVVDVAASSTSNQLSQDLLFNMPIRQGNTATNLLNFAPGINNGAAYGGDAGSGNGLLIDGVDTRDPSGGTAWTFYNFNVVQEVQFVGLGAPAEYGAFTGAIVNTITKSGGNQWGGLFDVIYSKGSLAGNNISSTVKSQNPSLADPAKTNKLLDFTTQLSGPLIKDKLFFFASAQRYHLNQDPTGPVTVRDEVSPRLNFKLTYQPNANDNITGHLQYDNYNIIGRAGVSTLLATDDLTNHEDAPEYVWLLQWRHLFGAKTFSEVKYTGWWGFYDLNPKIDKPQHLDGATGEHFNSQGWFYYADRGRHQVNASISHYAEAFGKHDLKFGVEIERSKDRDRYGYVNGIYYYDFGGKPYLAYNYSYDISGHNERESFYAQDSWHVGNRLTINPGLRLDLARGKNDAVGTIYDTKNLAPRLGFAWDLTGDQKTVVKGNYGQYYDGVFYSLYRNATPGIQDRITYDVSACPPFPATCPVALRKEIARRVAIPAKVDPNVKQPRVDEFTLGFERAVSKDIRLAVTGIWRENKNFVGNVFPDARWTPTTVASTATPTLPSQTLGVYRWANPTTSQTNVLITNPDGFQYLDPSGNVLGTYHAQRTYKALMAVVNKRFSQRWMAQVSYVLSKSEGTIDNTSGATLGGGSRRYETPSLALVNVKGSLTNDRTHEIKVMLGVQVPVVDLGINAYFRSLSGRNYTPFQQFGSSAINFPPSSAGRQILLEPRGSRRLPQENYLDLRLEKIFTLGQRKDRIALYADITNALNAGTITSVLTRVPSTAIAVPKPGGGSTTTPVLFEAPGAVIAPRQITLGARWSF